MAQEMHQEAAATTPEQAEADFALPISTANTSHAVPTAAASLPQPVPPLLQAPSLPVPPLPQYVPPLPQYFPPLPQRVPPPPVMGIPVPSPWPSRCAKPDGSNVVISPVEGGALKVHMPGDSPMGDDVVCLAALLMTVLFVVLPCTICILPLWIADWVEANGNFETILLSPDFFCITTTRKGKALEQRGSTSRLQAIAVRDLNSPQPPPPVHGVVATRGPRAAAARVPAGYQAARTPSNLVCVLVEEQQNYRFGETLSDAEKHWVVSELSHHLHCMHLYSVQHTV